MNMELVLSFDKCKTDKDLQEIYEYEVDVFAEAGNFEWSLENLKSQKNDGWEIYGVRAGDEIIAALFLRYVAGTLYTKNTSMKLAYQGLGFSHRIKEFYEQKASEKKAKAILNDCAVDNFRTIALNESHGYEKIETLGNGEITRWKKVLGAVSAVMVMITPLLILLNIASVAYAVNLQDYQFSDSYRYALLDDTLILRHPGDWVFTSSVAYINSPLVVSDQDGSRKLRDFLENFWVTTLGATHYFSKTFAIHANINFLSTNYSQDIGDQDQYLYHEYAGDTRRGLGDSLIKATWRFYSDMPNRVALSLVPKLHLPTGDTSRFTSDNSLRSTLLLVGEKYWRRLSLLGAIGYSTAGSNARYYQVDYRDTIPTQLGLSYRLNNDWNTNFEFIRDFALRGGSDRQDSGDYYLSMKGKIHKLWSLYFGGGIAGVSDIDKENWTVFAGIKVHPFIPSPRTKVQTQPEPITSREDEKVLGTLAQADRVYFDNNSAELSYDTKDSLMQVADFLLDNDDKINRVVIEGYASKVGPSDHNQKLSKQRARNVLNFLVFQGVNRSKLTTVAYGDDYLDELPEHWQNRRVEFRVYMHDGSTMGSESFQ